MLGQRCQRSGLLPRLSGAFFMAYCTLGGCSLRSARKIGAPSCCENILGFSHVHGVFAKALSLLSALWRRAILVLMFSMWKA